ncbi:MAG: TolC family protein [Bacteroidales bacterium]|jgi:NodT family efflux transporter outer membrane factor (OMF) lipoprotein|nr:TolC family protein [Bacteroidales bacterium]
MKRKIIFLLPILVLSILAGSCGIYTKYSRPDLKTSGLYRLEDTQYTQDSVHFGNIYWRDFFTDTCLQHLIEKALDSNFDYRIALERIKEYQIAATASKWAFSPTLSFVPSIGAENTSGAMAAPYQLPFQASWEIDVFGKLTNARRAALAALLKSYEARREIETNLVASIAHEYYRLKMYDRQIKIIDSTAAMWDRQIETMRSLKASGRATEVAVSQAMAKSFESQLQIPEMKQQIRVTENKICLLMGEEPHSIARSKWDTAELIRSFLIGYPIQMLANRPDVRQAEAELMIAFANTGIARSAFYPNLTITFSGMMRGDVLVTNPVGFVWSALASLAQPIFNQGKNRANLQIAKARQEQALLAFKNVLLTAGNEVSTALYNYKTELDKKGVRLMQIESLQNAADQTDALLLLGTGTYLDVLSAQRDLLDARLDFLQETYERNMYIIDLYRAIGGGTK